MRPINITNEQLKAWSDEKYTGPSKKVVVRDYTNFDKYIFPENIFNDLLDHSLLAKNGYIGKFCNEYTGNAGKAIERVISEYFCDEIIYLIHLRYIDRKSYDEIRDCTNITTDIIKAWLSIVIYNTAAKYYMLEWYKDEYDREDWRRPGFYTIDELIGKYDYPENLYRWIIDYRKVDDVGYTETLGRRSIIALKVLIDIQKLTKEEETLVKLKFRDKLSNEELATLNGMKLKDIDKIFNKFHRYHKLLNDTINDDMTDFKFTPYEKYSRATVKIMKYDENDNITELKTDIDKRRVKDAKILKKYAEFLMSEDNFSDNEDVLSLAMPRELEASYNAFKKRYTKAKWMFGGDQPRKRKLTKVFNFCRWTFENLDTNAIKTAKTKEDIKQQTTILDSIITLYTTMSELYGK